MESDHRTISLNEPDIRPARNHAEAEEIGSLLLEEITHPGFVPGPEFVWQGQGFLRPTLIGAWSQNRLVGGASLSPYMEHAKAFCGIGRADAAQAIARLVAETDGIAVRPDHRREGIGSQIKAFCDSWAADHGAELILSIPTNEGARLLNEKAGYTVIPPDGYLTIKVFDAQGQPLHIPYADQRTQDRGTSMWAYKLIGQRTQHFEIGALTAS